jgi:hypothetical protein
MALFVVAALSGFALYWVWWLLRPATTKDRITVLLAIVAAVVLSTGLWFHFEPSAFQKSISKVGRLAEGMDQGTLARYLLGFILGLGAAYAIDREPRFSSTAKEPGAVPMAVLTPAGLLPFAPSISVAAAQHDDTPDPVSGASKASWITLGFAVTLLALFAPHIDRWLQHLTSLKTSVVEFQLANISTATKTIQPDARDYYVDKVMLKYLTSYSDWAAQDIAFLTCFALPNMERELKNKPRSSDLVKKIGQFKAQQPKLAAIHVILEKVVSPLADCATGAINNGRDIESVRQDLRPASDRLTQMIILEQSEKRIKAARGDADATSLKLERKRNRLWDLLGNISGSFDAYLDSGQAVKCSSIKANQAAIIPLRISDYETLPHLYGARAALLWFGKNDALALKVLQGAADKWEFDDLDTPFLRATLMYYQGESVATYFSLLQRMRSIARERQRIIKDINDHCPSPCDPEVRRWTPELRERAKRSELKAINLAAYAVAEDLAQGQRDAEKLQPIAEQYAQDLKEAAKDWQSEEDRDAFLDTANFVTVVTEARKLERDRRKIEDAVREIEKIVAREETRVSSMPFRDRADYWGLRDYRAHLAAGRGLID